ncbi:AraC family transcriptional regulator [Taklimakanibacter deserti]|uniref:AraC family transcriptional regulator n=1 Tax=Taklimakanibacter deserti TaxID=2267839 RepID=UPI000E656442
MLDRSSKRILRSASDPLSDMLRGLRLDGVDYGRCELKAPWAILMPAQEAARFHFIGRNGCWLLTPDKEWIAIKPGDAALLPRGAEHQLASAPGVEPMPLAHYEIAPVSGNIFDVKGGGEGESTLLFCGSLTFNVDRAHPLLKAMPELMRSCELALSEPAIPHLLEAMACEVTMNRIGSSGILARLADVLAAGIIRAWVERACGDATGWIAAARNPEVGRVLAQIHLDPSRDWSVEALARLMGASRSGFAERFTEIVGETPARYVAQVRMHQARQWLMRDRMRISVVARKLGYESEASFSRAFKRVIGTAPSNLRANG